MTPASNNIAIDPTIAGNLQGLSEVRVNYQFELSLLPIVLAQFPQEKLAKRVESAITKTGLSIAPQASAVLEVAVVVEPCQILQLGGICALYAVELAVRELVVLPRTANDLSGKDSVRYVDTWRHKAITGILLPRAPFDEIAALLFAGVVQQVDRFCAVWDGDQDYRPSPRKDNPDPDDHPPDPADPNFKKIKEKLEAILSKLAQGNEGSATLEKFAVSGTQVDFSARIRHRHVIKEFGIKAVVYDVKNRASGSFDIAKPASMNAKVCVDKPAFVGGGEICQELRGIADVLPSP